jgi:hypothetical protein
MGVWWGGSGSSSTSRSFLACTSHRPAFGIPLLSEIESGHAQGRALTPAGQGGTGDGARDGWDTVAYRYLEVGGRAGHKHVHSKDLASPAEAEACVVEMLLPPCSHHRVATKT